MLRKKVTFLKRKWSRTVFVIINIILLILITIYRIPISELFSFSGTKQFVFSLVPFVNLYEELTSTEFASHFILRDISKLVLAFGIALFNLAYFTNIEKWDKKSVTRLSITGVVIFVLLLEVLNILFNSRVLINIDNYLYFVVAFYIGYRMFFGYKKKRE